jgi:hypothetical protein
MATIRSTDTNILSGHLQVKQSEPEEINPHIHLSAIDSQLFADLMEAEEEPNELLRQAAKEYQQTFTPKRK